MTGGSYEEAKIDEIRHGFSRFGECGLFILRLV